MGDRLGTPGAVAFFFRGKIFFFFPLFFFYTTHTVARSISSHEESLFGANAVWTFGVWKQVQICNNLQERKKKRKRTKKMRLFLAARVQSFKKFKPARNVTHFISQSCCSGWCFSVWSSFKGSSCLKDRKSENQTFFKKFGCHALTLSFPFILHFIGVLNFHIKHF